MNTFTSDQLCNGLQQLGLKAGDTVLVHSDLGALGLPLHLRGKSRQEILQFYFDALFSVLGTTGTLAVPAYFYEYARTNTVFEVETSPPSKSLGAFSRFLCFHPGAMRSCHPLQSIAAVGAQAADLTGGQCLSGYGANSAWNRLHRMKGKILFLGIDMQPMTYIHYVEQQYGVPHLYFKYFKTPVIKEGKPLQGQVICAVRYLQYQVQYHLQRFQEHLLQKGGAKRVAIAKSTALLVDAEQVFDSAVQCLEQDIFYFLKSPPSFDEGQLPLI